jgi:hypothetical protein
LAFLVEVPDHICHKIVPDKVNYSASCPDTRPASLDPLVSGKESYTVEGGRSLSVMNSDSESDPIISD